MSSPSTVVDGLAVYRHDPTGPSAGTILLVHGTNQRAAHFSRLIPHLGDFTVFSYDRRGFGNSKSSDARTSMDGCVEDLLAVVGHVSAESGRPIVVGGSWGASITLAFLERHGDLVEGAGLWEASAFRQFWRGESLELAVASSELPPRDMVVTGCGGEDAFALLPIEKQDQLLSEAEAVAADGRLLVADSVFEDPASVTVPVCLGVSGEADWPYEVMATEWLSTQIPTNILIRIPETTHVAHRRQPEMYAVFIRQVVAFVADRVAAAADKAA